MVQKKALKKEKVTRRQIWAVLLTEGLEVGTDKSKMTKRITDSVCKDCGCMTNIKMLEDAGEPVTDKCVMCGGTEFTYIGCDDEDED